jgi:aminoglycoside phosphotransferase (APT) family kinase protein
MEREYRVLNALAPVFPYAPRPVLFGEDESVVGARFLLMECRCGTVVRKEVPEGMTITKEMAEMLCRNMIKTLYRLHILDYKAIGLEDFGKPTGYIRRQVEGWIKRYQAAMTPDAPTCDDIMAWLTAHIPSDSANPGLVHGDFKLDNILLDPDDPVNITGILDWEMATIGDPIADLAYALIYWKEENDPHPPPYDTMPPVVGTAVTREEMLSYYEELSGRIIANTDFYYCFNLFRLGAIIQQIYFRYHHRLTCDKRFGDLKKITAKLMQAAKKYVNR